MCIRDRGWIVVTQKSFQVVGGGHCERTEFHGLQVADAFYGYVVGSEMCIRDRKYPVC